MNKAGFYNQQGYTMTATAYYTLQAAYHYYQRGRYASILYITKRTGISYNAAMRFLTIALQLIAVDKSGLSF